MLLRQSRCSAGPCDQSHVAQLTASCSPLASSPASFFFTSCSTVTASPRFWKQSHRPVSSLVSTQRLTRDETARVSRGSLSLTAHGFVALRLSLTHRFGCVNRVLLVIPFDQAVHRRFGNAGEPLEVGGLAAPIFIEQRIDTSAMRVIPGSFARPAHRAAQDVLPAEQSNCACLRGRGSDSMG